MEQDLTGLGRIIRILDEEYTELQSAGLYREAEKVYKRKQVYIDMRNQGKTDERQRQQRSVFETAAED